MGKFLDESLTLVVNTVEGIRNAMSELRPPVLDEYGLAAALRWYGEHFAERTELVTVVRGEEMVPRLPPETEIALFRIAQEALTNVAKHSRAKKVTIALKGRAGSVCMRISDNGVGFDPKSQRQSGPDDKWGLITMRERAEAIGGHLRVETASGKGTRVIAEVPRHN